MSYVRYESDGKTFAMPALDVSEIFNDGKAVGREEGREEASEEAREAGREEGRAEELAKCEANHFVAIVEGDGSTELTFSVPFKPDIVDVQCLEYATAYTGAWMMFATTMNLTVESADKCCGSAFHSNASNGQSMIPLGASSVTQKFSQTEDGVCTLKNFVVTSNNEPIKFMQGVKYAVTCVKLPE